MIKLTLSSLFWGAVCGAVFPLALFDLIPYLTFYL